VRNKSRSNQEFETQFQWSANFFFCLRVKSHSRKCQKETHFDCSGWFTVLVGDGEWIRVVAN